MSQLSVICHINKYTLRCTTLSTGVLNVRSQHRNSVNFKTQDWLDWGVWGLGEGSGQESMAPGEDTGSRCEGKGPLVYQEGGLRKRIFLAVSTSDLATRNRIFLPPCRIRSTALKSRGDGAEEPVAAVVSASPRLRMQDWLAGAPPTPPPHALLVLCCMPGMAHTSCS